MKRLTWSNFIYRLVQPNKSFFKNDLLTKQIDVY